MLFKNKTWVPVIVFLAGIVALFPLLRYYVDDADTFSYISIAIKYSEGNFASAINSTWSPLISVILSLLLHTHADVFLLFKLLQVLLGLSALLLSLRLIQLIRIEPAFGLILSLVLVPSFWAFSLLDLSADLLFLNLLLLIHVMLLKFNGINRKYAMLIGILGGMLYLAKAYGIFFFPLLCLFGYALIYIQDKDKRKAILKNVAVSMTAYILISAAWITAMSQKYQRFTVTDAPAYNSLLEKNMHVDSAKAHLQLMNRLVDPVPQHLNFAWEDPTLFIPEITANSTLTYSERKVIFKKNVLVYYYFLFRRQIGWLFIAAIIIGLLFQKRNLGRREFVLLAFTAIVFPFGYFFLHLIARYIFIITILMAVLTAYISSSLWKSERKALSFLLFLPLCILLVKRPAKQLVWTKDEDKTSQELLYAFTHLPDAFHHTYDRDKAIFIVKDSLLHRNDLNGTMANYPSVDTTAKNTLLLRHYLKNIYYGQINDERIRESGIEVLQKEGVDFYYVWNNNIVNDSLVKSMKLMFEDNRSGLRIFRMKN